MSSEDGRPPVWVGHITMETDRLEESETFMEQIGMRPMFRGDDVAVMELRGGTHLVLLKRNEVKPDDAAFDLMVDDIDATYADFASRGLGPSQIARGEIHASFEVTEPAGHRITFNSTHVSGQPV